MPNEPHQLFTTFKTPLAHIQPFHASPNELFGVERRVLGLNEQRAAGYLEDIRLAGFFHEILTTGVDGIEIMEATSGAIGEDDAWRGDTKLVELRAENTDGAFRMGSSATRAHVLAGRLHLGSFRAFTQLSNQPSSDWRRNQHHRHGRHVFLPSQRDNCSWLTATYSGVHLQSRD
jgi:hypothetical protein